MLERTIAQICKRAVKLTINSWTRRLAYDVGSETRVAETLLNDAVQKSRILALHNTLELSLCDTPDKKLAVFGLSCDREDWSICINRCLK
ncbi:hypothetical protein OPQ81_006265 [Rhizoctonia solani]|nr:hypothetical protein OPQ81_006265 [Rhizoctonia solani]